MDIAGGAKASKASRLVTDLERDSYVATLMDPSTLLVTVLVETVLVTDPPLDALLDMARAMCDDETDEA